MGSNPNLYLAVVDGDRSHCHSLICFLPLTGEACIIISLNSLPFDEIATGQPSLLIGDEIHIHKS